VPRITGIAHSKKDELLTGNLSGYSKCPEGKCTNGKYPFGKWPEGI